MPDPMTLQQSVDAAVALLPPAGETVEFNTYKAQLYAVNPDGGRDAFTHMIKRDLVKKKVTRDAEGKITVLLSRPA